MKLPIIEVATRNVPCGECTACCQNDAIFMHPECGDDPAQYLTERYDGRLMLQHQPNGDCIYLDRSKGCTIWSRRPAICRELDCRTLLAKVGEKQMKAMGMGSIVTAAKNLMNRLENEAKAAKP